MPIRRFPVAAGKTFGTVDDSADHGVPVVAHTRFPDVPATPGRGRVAIRISGSRSAPVVARHRGSDPAHKEADRGDPTSKHIVDVNGQVEGPAGGQLKVPTPCG